MHPLCALCVAILLTIRRTRAYLLASRQVVERRTRGETRERLLDAAEQEFALGGFSGTRLADIAGRLGIRRPSLLYHFSTKEELYTAVVERTFADLGGAMVDAMEGARGYRERLTAPIERFASFLEARPAAGRLLLRELLDGRGPGRRTIALQGPPILALVESFIRAEAGDRIAPDYPVRAALMQTVCNLLMFSAADELQDPLWGGGAKLRDGS